MTVNELIAELQVLAAQGHGELDVTTYNDEYADYDVVDSVEKMSGIKKIRAYTLNPLSNRLETLFVGIR